MKIPTPINKNSEWVEATKREMEREGTSFEEWRDENLRAIKLALFDGKGKDSKSWENYIIEGLCQRYWMDKAPKPKKKKISKPSKDNLNVPSFDNNTHHTN